MFPLSIRRPKIYLNVVSFVNQNEVIDLLPSIMILTIHEIESHLSPWDLAILIGSVS